MGMPNLAGRWTRAEVLELPDDRNRYELVDGELLVSPSPSSPHQWAVSGLHERIAPFVREHRLGAAAVSPADLDFRAGHLLQPDLFVTRLVEGRRPRDWAEVGVPHLVVEVLSPSTARYDRIVKRAFYQRAGVAEYWIVDLDGRVVERWRPGDDRPEIVSEALGWQPEAAAPALTIDLPGFFREVWGELA
jgi:Uma2 family endonuclease